MKTTLYLIVFLILISACGDKTTVTQPESTPNQPPIIDRLILPNQIQANTPLKLQVIARDTDKDKLSIVWQASEGTIESDVWTPPDKATQVVISVHVTDKINATVTKSQTVTVIAPPPPLVVVQEPKPEPPPAQEPEPSPEPEAWNIVRGVGIEHVSPNGDRIRVPIGETLQVVKNLATHTVQIEPDVFVFSHPRLGEFRCLFNVKNEILSIFVTDPRYSTPEGIRIGSTRDKVIKAYGQPTKIFGVGNRIYEFKRHGYYFIFDGGWRVASISMT